MAKSDIDRKEKIVLFLNQLSIFLLLVVLFFGALYMFSGNLTVAVPISLVLVILMFIISNSLIGAKMQRKKSGFSVGARVAWGIYILLIIPVTVIAIHGFTIEFYDKKDIQDDALAKINYIQELNQNFIDQYQSYCTDLNLCLNEQYQNYRDGLDASDAADNCGVPDVIITGLTSSGYATQIKTYVDDQRASFEAKANENFGEDLETFLTNQTDLVKNWNRFKIAAALTEIDSLISHSETELGKYLNDNADSRQLTILNPQFSETSVLAQPFVILKRGVNVPVYLTVLFLHFFLLLPYLMAPKKTYGVGRKKKSDDVNGIGVTER